LENADINPRILKVVTGWRWVYYLKYITKTCWL